MTDLLLMSQIAQLSVGWEAKYRSVESAVGKPAMVEYLHPHLDALERVYAGQLPQGTGRQAITREQQCALSFLALWERENLRTTSLLEATVHLWLSNPPVPQRAARIARECSDVVEDCFGTKWNPDGTFEGCDNDDD